MADPPSRTWPPPPLCAPQDTGCPSTPPPHPSDLPAPWSLLCRSRSRTRHPAARLPLCTHHPSQRGHLGAVHRVATSLHPSGRSRRARPSTQVLLVPGPPAPGAGLFASCGQSPRSSRPAPPRSPGPAPPPAAASRPPYPVQQPLESGRLRNRPGLPPRWQAAAAGRGPLRVPQGLAEPVRGLRAGGQRRASRGRRGAGRLGLGKLLRPETHAGRKVPRRLRPGLQRNAAAPRPRRKGGLHREVRNVY